MAEDMKQFVKYPSFLNDHSLGFFRSNSQSFNAPVPSQSQPVTQEKSLPKDVEAVGLLPEVVKDMHNTLRSLGGSELASSKRKKDAELCSGGKGLSQGASGSSPQPSRLRMSSEGKVKGEGSSLLRLPSPNNVVRLQAPPTHEMHWANKSQQTGGDPPSLGDKCIALPSTNAKSSRLIEGGSQDRSVLAGQVLKLVGATKEDQPIPSSAEVALTKVYIQSLKSLRGPTSNSDLHKEVAALKSQVEALSSDKTELTRQLTTLKQANTRLEEEKSRLDNEEKYLRIELKHVTSQLDKKCQTIFNIMDSVVRKRNEVVRTVVEAVIDEYMDEKPDHIDFGVWEEWAAHAWHSSEPADEEEAVLGSSSDSDSEVGSPS